MRFKRFIRESKDLAAWFGDSKVVDKDGKPMKLYRGQPSEYNNGSLLDRYFGSDPAYASSYANNSGEGSPNTLAVYMIMRKPFFSSDRNYVTDWTFWDDRDKLIAKGYDGIATKDKTIWFPFDTDMSNADYESGDKDKTSDRIRSAF